VGAFKECEEMSSAERWTIAVTVMFGAFIAVMDTSVVNVAMKHMMGSFGADMNSITWVAISYSIAEIIMVTMAGWWSSLIGRKTLYIASYAVFTIGSILCGLATSFEQMIIFRVIQGIGGGALIPISQAILRETFPPEQQGTAMSLYGMGVVLAPALGPILGGWITDNSGWPWIFYINVPVGILGLALTAKFIFDPPYLRRGMQSIDWLGIILLTTFLTGMQIILEKGQKENWFESPYILWGTVVTLAALLALIIWEHYYPAPVVNFRVFKDKGLAIGSTMGFIFGISLYGTTFILPQFTQQILGYPAFESGLALAPRALTLLLFMPVAGWLYQRIGSKGAILIGIIAIIWSYYDLTKLSVTAGMSNLVWPLLIMGAGMPFMFVPLSAVSLSTISKSDMTDASGMYTLTRRIGGNIGYALVATLLDRGVQAHRVYLSEHITQFSQSTQAYRDALVQSLTSMGVNSLKASKLALGMLEKVLTQQSTMLAYNDISFIFGCMFFLLVPFLFFLPPQVKTKK